MLAVSSNPLWAPVLPLLKAARTGFDAYDDWRDFTDLAALRPRITAGYGALAGVDVVTSNTSVMARRIESLLGINVVVVPNGVSLDAYRRPPPFPGPLPSGPCAVYVGVIQDRVSVDWLEHAARALAGRVHIVIAGPAAPDDAERLRVGPCIWLGEVASAEVPGLLARASVGLLPHRVNSFTESMDPLKLLEYLAAGLPVVASPLPGVGSLSPLVRVTEDADSFANAILEAAIRHPSGAERQSDRSVLSRDWSVISSQLLDLLLDHSASDT